MSHMTYAEKAAPNSVVTKMRPYFSSLVLIIKIRGGISNMWW